MLASSALQRLRHLLPLLQQHGFLLALLLFLTHLCLLLPFLGVYCEIPGHEDEKDRRQEARSVDQHQYDRDYSGESVVLSVDCKESTEVLGLVQL